MKEIISIKDKFIKDATPGIGRVMFDINLNISKHTNEINMALWLKETFGGNIKVLQEKDNLYKVSHPDFYWNEKFWEFKTCTSITSIDNRIRKAVKQLKTFDSSLIGGIILDCTKIDNDKEYVKRKIKKRLFLSCKLNLIVLIKIKNTFIIIENK